MPALFNILSGDLSKVVLEEAEDSPRSLGWETGARGLSSARPLCRLSASLGPNRGIGRGSLDTLTARPDYDRYTQVTSFRQSMSKEIQSEEDSDDPWLRPEGRGAIIVIPSAGD